LRGGGMDREEKGGRNRVAVKAKKKYFFSV